MLMSKPKEELWTMLVCVAEHWEPQFLTNHYVAVCSLLNTWWTCSFTDMHQQNRTFWFKLKDNTAKKIFYPSMEHGGGLLWFGPSSCICIGHRFEPSYVIFFLFYLKTCLKIWWKIWGYSMQNPEKYLKYSDQYRGTDLLNMASSRTRQLMKLSKSMFIRSFA